MWLSGCTAVGGPQGGVRASSTFMPLSSAPFYQDSAHLTLTLPCSSSTPSGSTPLAPPPSAQLILILEGPDLSSTHLGTHSWYGSILHLMAWSRRKSEFLTPTS